MAPTVRSVCGQNVENIWTWRLHLRHCGMSSLCPLAPSAWWLWRVQIYWYQTCWMCPSISYRTVEVCNYNSELISFSKVLLIHFSLRQGPCRTGWLWTHRELSASASWVLWLEAWLCVNSVLGSLWLLLGRHIIFLVSWPLWHHVMPPLALISSLALKSALSEVNTVS